MLIKHRCPFSGVFRIWRQSGKALYLQHQNQNIKVMAKKVYLIQNTRSWEVVMVCSSMKKASEYKKLIEAENPQGNYNINPRKVF